jgi:hypothetical protein
MSFCDSYLVLSIISIILILSIIIIILYKNNEDNKVYANNKIETKLENYIETFLTLDSQSSDKIISNHNKINDLITQINNVNPSINYKTKDQINYNLQKKISDKINGSTNDIFNKTSKADEILSKNITTLSNQLTDLENIISTKISEDLKTIKYSEIKSLNNGMAITLTNTPNTQFIDKQTGVSSNAYLVNINDGCLSVGATDYDIYKCNDKNSKHLFKMKHILSEDDYNKNIDIALPFDNIDKSKVNYPFVMMKSVNNDNCLTNQNGNITVQPCYSYVSQRWLPEL